jgi:hypothetical protein
MAAQSLRLEDAADRQNEPVTCPSFRIKREEHLKPKNANDSSCFSTVRKALHALKDKLVLKRALSSSVTFVHSLSGITFISSLQ